MRSRGDSDVALDLGWQGGVEVGDESVQVRSGHSAWFDAARRHAYQNATAASVTFTLVVFDPA
jgi:hypothetical protein